MSKWRVYTIGELVKDKIIAPPMDGNHGDIHPKGNDFVFEGIPFIMASDIKDGVISFDECKFITKNQADGLRKGFAQEGDVLLTHKATIGRTAIVPKTKYPYLMLTPQVTYYRVIDTKLLENRYLKYCFDNDTFQKSLGLWAGAGSTRAYLGILGQHNLAIKIPCVETQRKIADVLSVLDNKIACNNRINTELEAMAKTLYDYWFVQFDFPDANGKPYKTSGGEMVYNAILKREIPAGWTVNTLSQIANITMGQSPAGESYNEDGIGTLFFQGSTDFGWLFPTPRQYTTSPARMAKKGDILLSVRAPVGDMNIANADCCIGRGLAALNSKSSSDGFLFYVMKYFKKVFNRRNAEGTTFGSMTKDDLHSLQVVCPEPGLLKRYDDIVSEYNKMIFTRSLENQDLIKLRDWLLPLLMNGQITVK
ncbi:MULTISPECIES: restriction endonuclease subunit S [Enterobacteriaceae]|uniref:restriction endonuclease subunit S n=1 Tax=Enterobacteriaceae TaxID=543 RepID=UPI000E045801|nr:restriction endonuclease subunit S [Klebsiella pneumoniae]EFD5007163.1 restriction endonuclease subunit S [Escherichia coli]EIT9729415.1 restriction endonuclease subunit S [Salmonella enterica]ELK4200404.1 restriction endonuclease subunit S [Salmonella enterica subsp. enterica]EFE8663901.1 restriction endonuclease subunit S [Escherichia coli]EIH9631523.1 restriction endonuclease subunit S [Escherichia coli]